MPAMKTSTIQDYKLVAFSVKNKLIVSQVTEKKKKNKYKYNTNSTIESAYYPSCLCLSCTTRTREYRRDEKWKTKAGNDEARIRTSRM